MDSQHKPPERKGVMLAWRWLEAVGAAAAVLAVLLVVTSTNASNTKERMDSIRIRQNNLEAVQRTLIGRAERFDALQQTVLRRLEGIDDKLDTLRDRL
ncbi:MAG: hypothetical protein ACR2P5_07695 [Gammaproteobacteria bacterium]